MSLQTGAPPPDESCTMSVSDILYTHFPKFCALEKADHRQIRQCIPLILAAGGTHVT